MNSEKPQQPKSDFSETFDNDELEIDVTYEEITPEEQLEIKKRVTNTVENDSSQSVSDIWLEGEEVEFTDFDPVEEPERQAVKTTTDIASEPASTSPQTIPEKINTDSIDPELETLSEELTDAQPEPTTKVPGRPEIPEKADYSSVEPELDVLSEEITDSEDEQINIPKIPENTNSESVEPELEQLDSSVYNSPTDSKTVATSVSDDLTQDLTVASKESATEQETIETTSPEEQTQQETTENQESSTTSEPELIADSWLDESETKNQRHQELSTQISDLQQQKAALLEEIQNLQRQKESAIAQQTQEIADNLIRMIAEGTRELKERKNNLLIDVEKLERRRERIRQEMRTTFAGSSQDLAVRIQGFKEYLVGSLQELATAAEKLDLAKTEPRRRPARAEGRPTRDGRDGRDSRDTRDTRDSRRPSNQPLQSNTQPQFTEQTFAEQTRRIRQLLDKYRTQPDYYGAPWQLRRTFEPIHAERVQEWFFEQGGRGAIKGMGSRLQNILIASAIVSVLYRLYRDRVRILVLVDTPEKLGEWRRGLQDCLGVSRNDFGANRGIVLFESADILVQRAERLMDDKLLPLIIIDEAEGVINLNLLKFPLWLAFAEKPQPKSSGYLY